MEIRMPNIRRGFLAAAAAVAVAVTLGATGILYYSSTRGSEVSIAAPVDAGAAVVDATTSRMRSILLAPDEQPAGSQVQETSLQQAAAERAFNPDVVVSPASCLEPLLQLTDLGKQAGWLQIGTRVETATSKGGQFSAVAATIPGGVDLSKLRAIVASCPSGTITLKSLGVTGTVTLKEFATPALDGAQTFGYVAETSFPESISEAKLAAELACDPKMAAVPVALNCASATERTSQVETAVATYSNVHYFSYVSSGDVLVEVCEQDLAAANQMAATLAARVQGLAG